MQGRSLVPLLKGQTPADWRKSFYYHYYEYPGPHHVRPHYGVVTDRYKLVHFYAPDVDYWELFDLQKDPHELRSVYDDPAYAAVVAELKRELDRLRAELKVPAEPPARSLRPSRRARRQEKGRAAGGGLSNLGGAGWITSPRPSRRRRRTPPGSSSRGRSCRPGRPRRARCPGPGRWAGRDSLRGRRTAS